MADDGKTGRSLRDRTLEVLLELQLEQREEVNAAEKRAIVQGDREHRGILAALGQAETLEEDEE